MKSLQATATTTSETILLGCRPLAPASLYCNLYFRTAFYRVPDTGEIPMFICVHGRSMYKPVVVCTVKLFPFNQP